MTLSCQHCAKQFEVTPSGAGRKYCGRSCMGKESMNVFHRSSGFIWSQATSCHECGVAFSPLRKVAGREVRYCSDACRCMAWQKANAEKVREYRNAESTRKRINESVKRRNARKKEERASLGLYMSGNPVLPNSTCINCGVDTGHPKRMYCKAPKCQAMQYRTRYAPRVRTCPCCGAQWTPIGWSASRGHCYSPECEEHRLYLKSKSKMVYSKARKVVERYATRSCLTDAVDWRKVFVRDKGHCKACGEETPSWLRGIPHSRSPEVDHIVPLSKGGAHAMHNVQLLCRACNGAKADRLVIERDEEHDRADRVVVSEC